MAKPPSESDRLELLQGTLDMLILKTLQWGPRHGHGIGQSIRARTDELLKVETGSLYPALHRLEKQGWLKSEWGARCYSSPGEGFMTRPIAWTSCAHRLCSRASCAFPAAVSR
jgi:hypothetical protein